MGLGRMMFYDALRQSRKGNIQRAKDTGAKRVARSVAWSKMTSAQRFGNFFFGLIILAACFFLFWFALAFLLPVLNPGKFGNANHLSSSKAISGVLVVVMLFSAIMAVITSKRKAVKAKSLRRPEATMAQADAQFAQVAQNVLAMTSDQRAALKAQEQAQGWLSHGSGWHWTSSDFLARDATPKDPGEATSTPKWSGHSWE